MRLTDENDKYETLELEVIDINGQSVYQTSLCGKSSYNLTLNLLSGMYFAKVKGKKMRGVKRFIVA